MPLEESITFVRDAFRDVPRPERLFVRGTCLCCECMEYEALLASHTPDDITINELGSEANDPMCAASDHAFAWYMPALVRLAVEDPYYMDQLMFHLTMPGRVDYFTAAQARAVLQFMWAWSQNYLEQMAPGWNITGQIHRFDEALRRLEAASDGRPFSQ